MNTRNETDGMGEGERTAMANLGATKGSRIDLRVYESGSSLEVLDLVSRCNGNGPLRGVIPCIGVVHA